MGKDKDSLDLLLSDFSFELDKFDNLDPIFENFKKDEFEKLNYYHKIDKVCSSLLSLIKSFPTPCFLLPSTISFIKRISDENIIEKFSFSIFELWLNQYSNLNFEENYNIRTKIVGKNIPREAYQHMFPIGMGKVHEGSHYVTAHISPDLDSTIASFWGWMDAFGARVSKGVHFWNIPGGPPSSLIEIDLIFKNFFGEGIFLNFAKKRSLLTLTSSDFLTQEDTEKKEVSHSIANIDHENGKKAVLIVDEQGYYLGDWRTYDAEGVRTIIMLLNNCLRWFENDLHLNLINIFSKKEVVIDDILVFAKKIFARKIKECDPAKEYTESQNKKLNDYLQKVLGVKDGLESSFEEFGMSLFKKSIVDFDTFHKMIVSYREINLFDAKGNLIENRPVIFSYFKTIMQSLHEALQIIRNFVEKSEIALKIKKVVFDSSLSFLTLGSEVEEIKSKLESYQYLSVVYPDQGKLVPLGVVRAKDVREKILGTVSLRDFCNEEEIKMPSYLQVISVIDHHKSSLNTYSPPLAIIGDVQASNCLVAEQSFIINDKYSTGGMSKKEIEDQLKDENLKKEITTYRSILNKLSIAQVKTDYFVDYRREFIEYLHFLYGILDDTDLLMKVSHRDVECVAILLNKMKSIMLKKEVQIISLNDIPKDKDFAVNAANRILKNKDMYSLYRKVYLHKEKEVEKDIKLCTEGKYSRFFADVKIINGCCRVSQTKMFKNNVSIFFKQASSLRDQWIKQAEIIYKERNEIDLHLHMISTIRGADEVFEGKFEKSVHKDELWIWIPPASSLPIEHLKSFLNSFQKCPQIIDNDLEVEFSGSQAKKLDQIFTDSFLFIPRTACFIDHKARSIAILKYSSTSLNSRKSMIAPYLPNLLT